MAIKSGSPEFNRALNEGARLLHQNRPGEALAELQPLLKVDPGHPDLAINIGGAYILQRKWNKAVQVLNRAAEIHPDNVMILTNLGAAHLGRLETAGPKQQERAIKVYQRVLQIDPRAPNIHYHLGLIYYERGEFNRSAAFFQRALEIDPADKDARIWLDRFARLNEMERREADGDDGQQSASPPEGSEVGDSGED